MVTPEHEAAELVRDLAWFDALPADEAQHVLLPCCASRVWAASVVARRPYRDVTTLAERGAAAVLGLAWVDVLEALAAHPRIGERAHGSGTEATWSRREQAGMTDAGDDLRLRMQIGNSAYEERFGHLYLVCASGLSPNELLDRLIGRLGNDEATEREVVRRELALIVALRLRALLGP